MNTNKYTQKKYSSKKNKTKKTNNELKALESLPKDTLQRLCKVSANTFSRFEDEYEKSEAFIKKGMSTKSEVEKKLINMIETGSHDQLRPQDDFYGLINNVWVKDAKLTKEQQYIVQLDDFRLVQYKVYTQLVEIIDEYIKNNKNNLATQLNNFYTSVNKGLNEKQFNYYCKTYIEQLDEMRKDKKNLWRLLTMLNKNEFIRIGSPIVCTINPDEKNSSIFSPHINAVQLSLSDPQVYINDGKDIKYKNKIKSRYFKYIRQLSNVALKDKTINHKINPQDVFEIEYDLLVNMGCDSIKNGAADGYNKVNSSDSLKKYNFDWKTYALELGYGSPPAFFVVNNLNYLKCTCELLLKEWDSEKWRSYWIYLFMKQITRSYDKTNFFYFDFFSKFLQGQQLLPNFSISAVAYTSLPFNTFLTNEYTKKYERKENLDYVGNMAYDLRAVFKRTLRNNDWLSPKTKKKALLKLDKLKIIIGTSQIMHPDPDLEYEINDFWANMNKIFEWRLNKVIEKTGKEIIDMPELDLTQSPAKFVGKQAYIVNAFYTPSENSIYIPVAYIQKPFVDLGERGIEYNLAHLGFTIGHELSHSLDDWGSKYDEKGNLNDWWTEHDRKIFRKKQDNVIAQYEAFALQDGIKFDAKPSIGEDLADISGLAICEEYLRDFQDKNEDIVPVRTLSFKAFFVYYAFQMRQKINKKAIAAQLHTNPHPLDKYRTNVPLSRLELFRALYDIKKGDKMYWPSTDKIW
jgi:predicted metalloendopeptidase